MAQVCPPCSTLIQLKAERGMIRGLKLLDSWVNEHTNTFFVEFTLHLHVKAVALF